MRNASVRRRLYPSRQCAASILPTAHSVHARSMTRSKLELETSFTSRGESVENHSIRTGNRKNSSLVLTILFFA